MREIVENPLWVNIGVRTVTDLKTETSRLYCTVILSVYKVTMSVRSGKLLSMSSNVAGKN